MAAKGSLEIFVPIYQISWYHSFIYTAVMALHFALCKKVKVKVTLVQALRLCTGRTAHRGSRGIDLPFHDHGTRRG
jgi:hypothetical protein